MTNDVGRQTIAVGVVSRNEAADLEACLTTIPWATEIFVLDMQSSDDTRAVAAKFGATVIEVPVVPVAEQIRNAYLTRFTSDWLLQMDCDERLAPDWRRAVEPILEADFDTDVAAYKLPFRLFALESPLRHGLGANPSVRLFRRGRVIYPDNQVAHRNPVLDGSLRSMVGRVPPVDHFSVRSVDAYVEKCIRYAKTEAEEITLAELDSLVAFREFYRVAVAEAGWRDGFPGVAMAMVFAFSRGLAHLYAWERLGGTPAPAVPRRPPRTKRAFRRQLDHAKSAVAIEKFIAGSGSGASPRVRVSAAISDDPSLPYRAPTYRYLAYRIRQRLRG